MKKLREIVEATKSLHPMALHVQHVMVNGQPKYKVHAVGKDLADGIKHGEHLSDSELDDAHEMGAKVKHVKESVNEGKMSELDSDLENMKDKDFETHYGKPKSDFKSAKKPISEPKSSNVKEATSHQAATTMKHIPNASPALKKAAKDIKPGIAGFRDRIAMLKAGNVKEDVEQIDEISTKLLAKAAHAASDPMNHYDDDEKFHDPQKFADHAKKTKDAKSASAVQGAADAKGHYVRPGHTLGAYDKLSHRKPARVTSTGKANKQDVKTLKGNIQRNEETDFGPEADKNITVQLKKAMDMMEHGEKPGSDIEFADGQKHFVEGVIAHKVLVAMEQMKPEIRAQAQNAVYQSFAHLMAAHQMLSK